MSKVEELFTLLSKLDLSEEKLKEMDIKELERYEEILKGVLSLIEELEKKGEIITNERLIKKISELEEKLTFLVREINAKEQIKELENLKEIIKKSENKLEMIIKLLKASPQVASAKSLTVNESLAYSIKLLVFVNFLTLILILVLVFKLLF